MAKPKKIKLKLKTHKGAQKRFKLTGTGKVVRHHAFARHILTSKFPLRTLPPFGSCCRTDCSKGARCQGSGVSVESIDLTPETRNLTPAFHRCGKANGWVPSSRKGTKPP